MTTCDVAGASAVRPEYAMRADRVDWPVCSRALAEDGFVVLPAVLARTECARVSGMYGDACTFRSRVIMGRHGFGRGEYQYFADPLPEPVGALRESFYRCVAPIANEWEAQLGSDRRFPTTLAAFRQQCRDAGQRRPTPLLLKYEPGDYNCLHQDLYGALDFPLQLAVLLSQPGDDFEGGEFVLTEQRPRMQSRVQVVPLARDCIRGRCSVSTNSPPSKSSPG